MSAPGRGGRKPKALKLNFDGSSKGKSMTASIDGVYRDHRGNFVLGYAGRIGKATSSVAELAALKHGLKHLQQDAEVGRKNKKKRVGHGK